MTNAPFKRKVIAAAVASAVMGSSVPLYAQDSSSLQEVVVTGSRIKRTDLSAPSPVAVVGAAEIEATGTVNMEQLLNELPQIIPGFTNSSNNPGTGTATIDLRGLGAVRTLVLVDGKRMVPTLSDGTVDVNNMPASLIERVEVVTGGQSATYGSDALAGAVNFILKHDFEGFEVNAQYEITDEGDGDVYTANAAWGTNFSDGRGNVTIYANYNNRQEVFADARKFSSVTFQDGIDDAGNPALVPGGSSGTAATRYFVGTIAAPGSSITFDENGNSRTWLDPEDRFNYAPDNYLQLPQDRYQVNAMGDFEINQHFVTYLDTQFVHHNTPTQLAPTPAFVSSTTGFDFDFGQNPFLSAGAKAEMAASEAIFDPYFGQPTGDGIARALFFGRRMIEVGPRQSDDDFRMYRILAGVKGEINDRWDYDSFFIYGNVHQTNVLRNDIYADRFLQGLNVTGTAANPVCIDPSNGCVPINIWGEGVMSQEAADYVRLNLNSFGEYEQMMGGINFTGSIPGFAAGDIGLAGGIEYRDESFQFRPDAQLEAGNVLGFNAVQTTAGDYNVIDVFAETDIPLLKDHAWAEKLNVNAKVRVGEYSSVGQVTSWSAGGEWVPIHGFRIRGGYQRAVRAPNIGELFLGTSQGFPGYVDPCDANNGYLQDAADQAFCNTWGAPAGFTQRNVQVEGTFGGNPNLEEETSDSWNIGAVYEPEFLENFAITVDYFNIEITDAIATFGGGVDNLISGCFFTQDLTTELCQAATRDVAGNIQPVSALNANVSGLRTDGIDIQMDYTFDLMDVGMSAPGSINLANMSTYVLENGFQGNDALPFLDCVGTFGSPCGGWIIGTATPEWRNNFRATWMNGGVQVALNWRLISEVDDARVARADSLGLDGDAIEAGIPESARKIEMEHYLDISARWDFHEHMTLSGGIDNLIDNDPEVLGTAQVQSNTEPSTYDVLGRTFWAGLKLKW